MEEVGVASSKQVCGGGSREHGEIYIGLLVTLYVRTPKLPHLIARSKGVSESSWDAISESEVQEEIRKYFWGKIGIWFVYDLVLWSVSQLKARPGKKETVFRVHYRLIQAPECD
jgi:hypothetical protein